MKKERVLYLDLIRVVCFLMVTAYHFTGIVKNYGITANVDYYNTYSSGYFGPAAVLCFFMISGAALTYQYQENFSLKTFYKKRFLSIFPIFWIAYLFAFLDFFYVNKAVPTAPKFHFLLTLIGMDGYASYAVETFYMVGEWFLGAIILLYLLYPLYRWITRKCIFLLPILFGAGSMYLIYNNPFQMPVGRNLIFCSFFFTLGMMIEQLKVGSNRKLIDLSRRIYGIVGLIGIIFLMTQDHLDYRIDYHYVDAMMALFLYLFLMEVAEFIRFEWMKKALVSISKYSFAFFLIHHVFLNRYVSHFAGIAMSGTSTLVLFLSAVVIIYLLAICLVRLQKKLMTGSGQK